MLLAVDTATQMASLALYDEARGWVLDEESWHTKANHTVELMPRLVRLMEQQGASPDNLTGLVVSLGPGSFTGLRIGLGLAKGLALARRVPIVGVPTLDVVAHPHMTQRLQIWAILQAGRGRICAGHYVRRKGRWRRQGDYHLTTMEELCDEITAPAFLCGEVNTDDVTLVRARLGSEAVIATPAASLRRAGYLAELGWERLARGDSDDASTLSPIYLQQSQIDA